MSEFYRYLEKEIPRLRRYARALTRNVTLADDLAQETLARAIKKQHLWQPGPHLNVTPCAHAQARSKMFPDYRLSSAKK